MIGVTRIRSIRLLVAALVVAAPLIFQPLQREAGAGEGCSAPGRVWKWGRGWTTVFLPVFPPMYVGDASDGARSATAWAIDHLDPRLMFVSDGASVMRTVDGGCNWEVVLQIDIGRYHVADQAPDSNAFENSNRISELQITRSGKDVVVLAVADEWQTGVNVNEKPPFLDVWRSPAAGAPGTWELADSGLPEVGYYTDAAFSKSNPKVGYLTVNDAPSQIANRVVYRTPDAGASWQEVGKALDPVAWQVDRANQGRVPFATPHHFDDTDQLMAVDPGDEDVVWVWTDVVIRRSTDGGRTWSTILPWEDANPVPNQQPLPQVVDLHPGEGSYALGLGSVSDTSRTAVAVFKNTGNVESCGDQADGRGSVCTFVSSDGGESYQILPPAWKPQSIGKPTRESFNEIFFGRKSSSLVGIAGNDIWRFESRMNEWIEMTPFYSPAHLQAIGFDDINFHEAARDAKGVFYFFSDRTIEIYSRRI